VDVGARLVGLESQLDQAGGKFLRAHACNGRGVRSILPGSANRRE
jgi:hypothetical protein